MILFATAFALLCIAGAAVVLLAYRAADAEGWVAHTIEVRQQVRELMNGALNAETGVRGFLLTDDRAFLVPYNAALIKLPETLKELRGLTADNPAQQTAIDGVEASVAATLDAYRQMLTLAEQGRRDQAIELVRVRAGKSLMDDLRARVDRFSQAEAALLGEREAIAQRSRVGLVGVAIAALALVVGLGMFMGRLVLHYVGRLADRTAELEVETKRRRESEATVVQALKMEAVGQLTGGIAHDFNNMLTIIIGNLETLQRRLRDAGIASELAARLARPIEMATQGARSAAELTRRLLAFSRRQALAPTQVDLNRLVAGMSELLRRTVGEAVAVETVLAGGLWPTLVDANHLENVLVNLVVNARDAMPKGGKVTIETANAYLDDAYAARFGDISPGQYVLMSVSDTGGGIAPELLERVFEPFFSTKSGGEGSGLGLAMVHGFVKQSNGHIRLYSEVGHGTSVKIYLPRLAQAAPELAAPAAIAPPGAATAQHARPAETVLVVEDNDSVRDYARSALEDLGYRVIEARDAEEALRLVEDGTHLDLLFTDVVLGSGPNGRELANRIVEKRAGLPVLFTTGYSRNAIVHHGRLDPGVHLLDKPYTQHDLARKIRELLDTGRKAREGRASAET